MTNRSESRSTTKDDGQKFRLYVGNLSKVKTEKEMAVAHLRPRAAHLRPESYGHLRPK
jgi:hypothetical protein